MVRGADQTVKALLAVSGCGHRAAVCRLAESSQQKKQIRASGGPLSFDDRLVCPAFLDEASQAKLDLQFLLAAFDS